MRNKKENTPGLPRRDILTGLGATKILKKVTKTRNKTLKKRTNLCCANRIAYSLRRAARIMPRATLYLTKFPAHAA